MRITIGTGILLAVFLLLITPCVNSIEYKNQKNIIISEIETMDYNSFITMMKQIQKDELRALFKEASQNKPSLPSFQHLYKIPSELCHSMGGMVLTLDQRGRK